MESDAIMRIHREDSYLTISKHAICDETLSFTALGLLIYLLNSEELEVEEFELSAIGGVSVGEVRAALIQLKDGGYLKVEESEKHEVIYMVTDSPLRGW